MAQKKTVILEDDLDGGPATQTVRFALDQSHYEIDLTDANASALRDALNPYLNHGRRIGGQRTAQTATGDKDERTRIRDWARSQGMTVSKRGRISQSIIDLYHAQ